VQPTKKSDEDTWIIDGINILESIDSFNWFGSHEWNEAAKRDVGILLDNLPGQIGENARLLDLGCGIGRLEHHIKDKFGQICGVDVSPLMIEKAHRDFSDSPNIHFILTNGKDLRPLPQNYFDIAVSFLVLQHLPKSIVKEYFKEVHRILLPGGVFRIQVPILNFQNSIWSLLTRRAGRRFDIPFRMEPSEWNRWTVRLYTPSELVNLANVCGYDAVDVRVVHFVNRVRSTFPPNLFKKLSPRKALAYAFLFRYFAKGAYIIFTARKRRD
jgi:ubiquinone/menaquinone biosynthesis C-methylase UbiE